MPGFYRNNLFDMDLCQLHRPVRIVRMYTLIIKIMHSNKVPVIQCDYLPLSYVDLPLSLYKLYRDLYLVT